MVQLSPEYLAALEANANRATQQQSIPFNGVNGDVHSYAPGTPESSGWTLAPTEVQRRVIAAISGLEKSGKSRFALTASLMENKTHPVWVHNYDMGLEGTVEKFRRQGCRIYTHDYRYPKNFSSLPEAQKKIEASRMYEEFQRQWEDCLKRGEGTIVIDTHTEEWEVRRLAKFGKLTQVMPQHYTEVNNEFRADIREAYESGLNVILLQKLKKEYVNNNWTGKYEVSGYSDLPFLVQANIECYRDPNDRQFKAYVKDCRQNMALANEVLFGPFLDFGMFLNRVFE